MNPDDIKRLIYEKNKGLEEIFRKNDVLLAYLFGSVLRGRMTSLSDIDIAVLFSKNVKTLDRILSLSSEINNLLGFFRTEVVCLNSAPPLLKHRATIYGKAIFVSDPALKRSFELRVLQEYEDYKYYLERSFEVMRRKLKEGVFGRPEISVYSKYLDKKI